jgi:hypothetical protein
MSESGNIIEVEVDEATFKAIQLKLGNVQSKAPRVLKNAVNATAREAKKSLAAKAQQTYTIKTSKFNKNIKKKNATLAKPEALLKISGSTNTLESFQNKTNTKRLAAKAKVRTNATLKELISDKGGKAFKAEIKNGGKNHKLKNTKPHNAILQRVGNERLPLKGFYGPSDPVMVGSEKVYGVLKPEIEKLLYKNISKQIDKVLGGK